MWSAASARCGWPARRSRGAAAPAVDPALALDLPRPPPALAARSPAAAAPPTGYRGRPLRRALPVFSYRAGRVDHRDGSDRLLGGSDAGGVALPGGRVRARRPVVALFGATAEAARVAMSNATTRAGSRATPTRTGTCRSSRGSSRAVGVDLLIAHPHEALPMAPRWRSAGPRCSCSARPLPQAHRRDVGPRAPAALAALILLAPLAAHVSAFLLGLLVTGVLIAWRCRRRVSRRSVPHEIDDGRAGVTDRPVNADAWGTGGRAGGDAEVGRRERAATSDDDRRRDQRATTRNVRIGERRTTMRPTSAPGPSGRREAQGPRRGRSPTPRPRTLQRGRRVKRGR